MKYINTYGFLDETVINMLKSIVPCKWTSSSDYRVTGYIEWIIVQNVFVARG
jgi:hypothetical protein